MALDTDGRKKGVLCCHDEGEKKDGGGVQIALLHTVVVFPFLVAENHTGDGIDTCSCSGAMNKPSSSSDPRSPTEEGVSRYIGTFSSSFLSFNYSLQHQQHTHAPSRSPRKITFNPTLNSHLSGILSAFQEARHASSAYG